MASAEQLLSQLKDLHQPPPIASWPWAPGWYVLCFIVLASLTAVGLYYVKRHRRGRAKRLALSRLIHLSEEYQQTGTSAQLAMQLSVLLKQVALSYFPREAVASLEGEAWLSFLDATAKGVDFKKQGQALIVAPYLADPDVPLDTVLAMAKQWVRQRKV